jgi:hypothetical protein
MLDDPMFFPFLQRQDWSGRSACTTRPLAPPKGDLIIAYGVCGADENRYLTLEAQASHGYEAEDIHDHAVTNLRNRHGKIPWEPVDIGGESVLMRSGDPVISSDVLNPKGMRKVAGFMNGQRVHLGIPTCFTVLAGADGDLIAGIVTGLHREAEHERAGALSAQVFVVDDGNISGVYAAPDASRASVSLDEAKRAKLLTDGIVSVCLVIARSRGVEATGVAGAFWDGFRRKLGSVDGALAPFAALDAAGFTDLITQSAAHPRPLAGVRNLAKVMRHALSSDERDRVSRAAIASAIAVGQTGTGFFGIGRSLPRNLRLPIWGMAGVLGTAVP